jgi:glutamine amidotransferase
MQRIAVIDYGMGNLRSVSKAVEHVADGQAEVLVTSDRDQIENADRIVFPGQGAARDCMAEIHAHHLVPTLLRVITDRPFLGICMGMQVLLERSEEHWDTDCLNVIPGIVRALPRDSIDPADGTRLTVPQMGWNQVSFRLQHPLWHGIEDGSYFYFANSFVADPTDPDVISGTTWYGVEFTSALARGNLFATQFHPEKSARDGLQILRNFVAWDGNP